MVVQLGPAMITMFAGLFPTVLMVPLMSIEPDAQVRYTTDAAVTLIVPPVVVPKSPVTMKVPPASVVTPDGFVVPTFVHVLPVIVSIVQSVQLPRATPMEAGITTAGNTGSAPVAWADVGAPQVVPSPATTLPPIVPAPPRFGQGPLVPRSLPELRTPAGYGPR